MSRRHHRDEGYAQGTPFLNEPEDVNPSQYISNLADCMLVLAVGFMVALVAAYKVDVAMVAEVQDMTEISDVEQIAEDMTTAGDSYTHLGEVYQDPETGKIYMIAENEEAATGSAGESGSGE